jgi:dTDP-4-amino-4,6-dideoxygalactose transaminase
MMTSGDRVDKSGHGWPDSPFQTAALGGISERFAEWIPVYRPLLPSAPDIASYLELLDQSRWYSNHGELLRAFARRLSALFGSAEPIVHPTSSGTTALVGAILAAAGRASAARPLCFCPAYTFVGTAAAAEQCGYQPHFVDITEEGWAATPDKLAKHPLIHQVGLVVPVAAYGQSMAQEPWRRFKQLTGVPVVIDAAAGFEGLARDPASTIGEIPLALSLHATKAFATGEGGAVVCTEPELLHRSVQALNFGFRGGRSCGTMGTNGKMSEYHAAVGLAELDGWAKKRTAFARVTSAYRNAAERRGIGSQVITAPNIASCYVLYVADDVDDAVRVTAALNEARAEHRFWYGFGVHREPYYATMSRDELLLVDRLAPRLIGLPSAPDLSESAIAQILSALESSKGHCERAV